MTRLKIVVSLCLFVLAMAAQSAARHHVPVDTLRMFSAFPRVLLAFASFNDTAVNCSTATRTRFDPEAKTVTYVWHFKAHNDHPPVDIILDVSFGERPGQVTFFANQDTSQTYTAFYEYTDYATCAVARTTFEGRDHCALWIKEAVTNNVPTRCLNAYEETCNHSVPLIDGTLCTGEDE